MTLCLQVIVSNVKHVPQKFFSKLRYTNFWAQFQCLLSGDDGQSAAETLVLSNRKRKRAQSVKSGTSGFSQPPMKYQTGGVGIHR